MTITAPTAFAKTKKEGADSVNQSAKQMLDDKEEKSLLMSKLQLTKRERILLELILLSPIFVILGVLYTIHSFILTMFLFHLALIVLPLWFMKKKNANIKWKSFLHQTLTKKARKFKDDAKLIAIPAVIILSVYIVFRNLVPDHPFHQMRLPSWNDKLAAILLFIEFVIVNPVVEEIFWRFFADLFTGRGQTFFNKLDAAAHFALYHWFVAYFITQDIVISTCGFFGICVLGFVLSFIKEKHGLMTAMIFHVGVDLAGAIVVADIQSRFLPFY